MLPTQNEIEVLILDDTKDLMFQAVCGVRVCNESGCGCDTDCQYQCPPEEDCGPTNPSCVPDSFLCYCPYVCGCC
jgi:hypothetical protein